MTMISRLFKKEKSSHHLIKERDRLVLKEVIESIYNKQDYFNPRDFILKISNVYSEKTGNVLNLNGTNCRKAFSKSNLPDKYKIKCREAISNLNSYF